MKSFLLFLLTIFFLVGPSDTAYATQHDYVISNDTGANVRTDINNVLLAISSNNSGLTAPATTYAFQVWMDTTTGLLKIRNAANSAWVTLGDPSLTNLGLMPKTGGAFSAEVTFSNTDDIRIPQGTTAQRNGSPANGMIRYNTDLDTYEGYHESQFSSFQREVASSDYLSNYSLTASVSGNALTIALKTAAGSNAAAGDPAIFGFRSATLASGDASLVKTTAALSTVISSGSTAGHVSAAASWIYVYLINNAGTAELAWSTAFFDESVLTSTTAEGGAGAADSATVMYSTTARSNVAFRVVGKLLSTQTTAGTWAAVPTNIITGGIGKIDAARVPNLTMLTATSSLKTVAGTAQYLNMTGSSLSLTPGTWELFGDIDADNNAVSPQYTAMGGGWTSANGADNGTPPAALSSASNLTINSTYLGVLQTYTTGYNAATTLRMTVPSLVVTVTAPVTVYLVPFIVGAAPTNGRVTTRLNARKIY